MRINVTASDCLDCNKIRRGEIPGVHAEKRSKDNIYDGKKTKSDRPCAPD